MSETARVREIDVIRSFRVALLKFAESANVALSSAEGELHRTLLWLQGEQLSFWQGQVRKRTEILARAKDALRQKLLYKDSTGRTPTPIEEQKAVKRAQYRLEEAERKLVNTKRSIRMLEREIQTYKGAVQRFASMVQMDIPRAAERLDRAHGQLETYVSIAAPSPTGLDDADIDAGATMARPEPDDAPRPPLAPGSAGGSVPDANGATPEYPATEDRP